MKLITNMFIAILLTLTFSSCGDSSLDNLDSPPAAAPEINTAPIANAGDPLETLENMPILLTALGSSDEQGDALTYTWSIVPTGTSVNAFLSSTTSSNPMFTANKVGIYSIKLIVNDGLLDSEEANVYVTVNPVADAGTPPNSITVNTPISLDGSGSSPEVEYSWSILESESSEFDLENNSTATPIFTPKAEGIYKIQLIVNDGVFTSEPALVTINATEPVIVPVPENHPPFVDAGAEKNVSVHTRIDMNATSTDEETPADALIYLWTIEPDSSAANISDSSILNPSFEANVSGTYVLTLSVYDGKDSVEDNVTIHVIMEDFSLKANAGSNQEVSTSDTVQLDASLSTVGEDATLTYVWTRISRPTNSNTKLSASNVVNPTFIADVQGTYVFSLRVNDGVNDSDYAFVTINAADANVRPIAKAGVNQNVKTTTTIDLDGSLSEDANLDDLVYEWVMISKPSSSIATLSSDTDEDPSTIVNPYFFADVDGAYVFQLIVSDAEFSSEADYVTVQAETNNSIPTADAGIDQNVLTLSKVTLNGSNSFDPDKDQITYIWHIVSAPIESMAYLSNPSIVNPFFTADKDGTYVIQLVVNDGITNSELDNNSSLHTVSIEAKTTNSAPMAIAGSNQNVKTGVTVIVDASASTDADFDALTYSWIIASKPTTSASSLSDSNIVNPVFTTDVDGAYVLGVSVSDGTFESDRAYVTIVATTENSVPVANAGVDRDENVTISFDLNASGSSDADLDPLNYKWTVVSTPLDINGSYSADQNMSSNSETPTFTLDLIGSYVFELIVDDNKSSSSPDYVIVNVE